MKTSNNDSASPSTEATPPAADTAQASTVKPQDTSPDSGDWLGQWVDRAIAGSKRMEVDPAYRDEIRRRTK